MPVARSKFIRKQKNHGKARGAATHSSDDSFWEASGCEIALLHTGPRERLDSIS
jgi:hypothetical protein